MSPQTNVRAEVMRSPTGEITRRERSDRSWSLIPSFFVHSAKAGKGSSNAGLRLLRGLLFVAVVSVPEVEIKLKLAVLDFKRGVPETQIRDQGFGLLSSHQLQAGRPGVSAY
jgi:hypothetical protein